MQPYYPYYFFEPGTIDDKYLVKTSKADRYQLYDIVIGSRKANAAVRQYLTEDALKGLFYIEFDAVDAWFEEDQEIYVHPKDPYKASQSLDGVVQLLV